MTAKTDLITEPFDNLDSWNAYTYGSGSVSISSGKLYLYTGGSGAYGSAINKVVHFNSSVEPLVVNVSANVASNNAVLLIAIVPFGSSTYNLQTLSDYFQIEFNGGGGTPWINARYRSQGGTESEVLWAYAGSTNVFTIVKNGSNFAVYDDGTLKYSGTISLPSLTDYTLAFFTRQSNPSGGSAYVDYAYAYLDSPDTWDLTVNSPAHGSLNATSGSYNDGETVYIEATPDSHYYLDHWVVDGDNDYESGTVLELTMDQDHEVSAVFDLIYRLVTINTPSGGTINATTDSYPDGTTIYLEAVPSANYSFRNWVNDKVGNSTDNPLELLVEGFNFELSAYFDPYPVYASAITLSLDCENVTVSHSLAFSIQLLFDNGTPIASHYLRLYLNGTAVWLGLTDSEGWANSSWNMTEAGNSTLCARFEDFVDDTNYFIISGSESEGQNITVLNPPAPVPSTPTHYTPSRYGQLAIVACIIAAVIAVMVAKGARPRLNMPVIHWHD